MIQARQDELDAFDYVPSARVVERTRAIADHARGQRRCGARPRGAGRTAGARVRRGGDSGDSSEGQRAGVSPATKTTTQPTYRVGGMTVPPVNERSCASCSRPYVGADLLCPECRARWDRAQALEEAAVARQEAARRPGRPRRLTDLEERSAE